VRELQPRLVVPMHYRTEAVNFLDPPDAFLAASDGDVRRIDGLEAELEGLLGKGVSPVIGVLTPPT
jgi:L-ascorbate metabolism protein UlaG (beta-lactamase superfamily)